MAKLADLDDLIRKTAKVSILVSKCFADECIYNIFPCAVILQIGEDCLIFLMLLYISLTVIRNECN